MIDYKCFQNIYWTFLCDNVAWWMPMIDDWKDYRLTLKLNNEFSRSICNLQSCARRYHVGSVALGSLLIAICQLIRIFLEFLDRRLKGAENRIAKFVVKWVVDTFRYFVIHGINVGIKLIYSGKLELYLDMNGNADLPNSNSLLYFPVIL